MQRPAGSGVTRQVGWYCSVLMRWMGEYRTGLVERGVTSAAPRNGSVTWMSTRPTRHPLGSSYHVCAKDAQQLLLISGKQTPSVNQALGLVGGSRFQGIPNPLLELAHRSLRGQVGEVQSSRDGDVGRYDLKGEGWGFGPVGCGVGRGGSHGGVLDWAARGRFCPAKLLASGGQAGWIAISLR